MACPTCDRLTADLKARERAHRLALEYFKIVEESQDATIFQSIRARLSDARMEHELARLALDKHRQDEHAADD